MTGLIYMYIISVLKVETFETNCLYCIIVELIFLIEKYVYSCYNGIV